MSQSTSSMEANNIVEVACPDPDYITFIDPKQEYNCYFVVGNETLQNIEKIGVVKKMLLAHSVVLRTQLQDSKIAEKDDVLVPDIFPDTFKNLLRYVYGHDNTAALSFDEADNLLYAAEKYMMTKLKNKLATCLMSMLDYTNICSLMNNPVCYTAIELNSAITEILQQETDKVLASPQFMNLCPDGFLKIVEQETSSVAEIELWRSAIRWAKNRTNSENGEILRKELSPHLQLIRVCTLSMDDFCREVMPTRILTYDEAVLISQSCSTEEIQPELSTICNKIEKRDSPYTVKSDLLTQNMTEYYYEYTPVSESAMTLTTRDTCIELCSLELYSNGGNHQCSCTISIQKGTASPTVVRFGGELPGSNYSIHVLDDGKNVQLDPNSSYVIKLAFTCSVNHKAIYSTSSQFGVSGDHFTVFSYQHTSGLYLFHLNSIAYKTLTKKVKHVRDKK